MTLSKSNVSQKKRINRIEFKGIHHHEHAGYFSRKYDCTLDIVSNTLDSSTNYMILSILTVFIPEEE
jgi:hypothetical protein